MAPLSFQIILGWLVWPSDVGMMLYVQWSLRSRTLRWKLLHCRWASAQWDQIAKIRQKLDLKNSSNWLILLMSATAWQILKMKGMKWNYVNLLKSARKNLWNHCRWIYFWRVLANWTHLASQFANSYAKVARRLTAKNWFTSPDYHSYHFIRIRINATAFIHSIQIRQYR